MPGDTDETEAVESTDPVEKSVRTPKLTPLSQLYGPTDFAEFKQPERNASMIKDGNKPLKIETIVFEQKLGDDVTVEEVAAYEEATGSVKAHVMCRKKKVYVPSYTVTRHRKKPRAVKEYDYSSKTDEEAKEMAKQEFKDKTYFKLTHAQATELRKAPTHLKVGVPMDTKYDWLLPKLAPGCVWVCEVAVNLNDGFKIMGPDEKVINAPEEWRYFNRLFIGRLVATDEADEGDQAVEAGELLCIPPGVQLKWLNDDSIKRGDNIDNIFSKDSLEKTFRIPIRFDTKEWVDATKDGEPKKRPRANVELEETKEKKEKKTVKRKSDAKPTDPKKTPDSKIPETKTSSAKRSKSETVSSVSTGENMIAQLAEEARKSGKTLTMYRLE